MVYSDDCGRFWLRTRKSKRVTLSIQFDDFLRPGRWRVVTAPQIVKPGAAVEIVISLP